MALIAGPTASGKSERAVDLALALEASGQRAVVINADSMQVYADLAILSARPTPEDMRGIEHRLYGTCDGAELCSAADWARMAGQEISRAHGAGAVPILVGGTGLYIRTLIEGIAPVPPILPEVRVRVREMDLAVAYEALQREDPALARALHPSDRARIARALEVIRSTGRSLLHWQARNEGGIGEAITLHPLVVMPSPQVLYPRCDARFERMVKQGARDEVGALLARGLPRSLPVMRAIGVPQIAGWIERRWSRDEALVQGQQATRNYAKRQRTWFRRQVPHWPVIGLNEGTGIEHLETLFAKTGVDETYPVA